MGGQEAKRSGASRKLLFLAACALLGGVLIARKRRETSASSPRSADLPRDLLLAVSNVPAAAAESTDETLAAVASAVQPEQLEPFEDDGLLYEIDGWPMRQLKAPKSGKESLDVAAEPPHRLPRHPNLRQSLAILGADKARLSLALTLLAVLVTGAITFGSWAVGSGPGNGYSKALASQSLTLLDASASTSAQLYPGGTGDLTIKVSNPNPFGVTVTAVTGSGTITSNAGAACNASTGVTFTNTSGLSQAVGAGATVTFTLAGKVAMSNASDTSCQGAIFTVPISLTATS